jgi:2-keto-3-deoxy-L-rhamnonate aldolase RhmA
MISQRSIELKQQAKPAWGVHLSFLNPELVEYWGLLGFEWLFLDAEHQPLSAELCRGLVRAADLVGMPCTVRVPEISASVIESYLDVGVWGILAPNVSSAADAHALVSAVKFSPRGKRGAAGKTRAARYGLAQTPAEYARQANEASFTVALIESQQGLDELEAIMAVPGIDYVGIGANDLGLSLGIEGGMADARVRALVENAQARMKAFGKPQLSVVMDAGQGRKAVESGGKLIAVPDAALLASAGRDYLLSVR